MVKKRYMYVYIRVSIILVGAFKTPFCSVAVLHYLMLYGFCMPRVTENRSFFPYYKNCTLLRQYLSNLAASITQACYEDFKSSIFIAF